MNFCLSEASSHSIPELRERTVKKSVPGRPFLVTLFAVKRVTPSERQINKALKSIYITFKCFV